MELHPAIIHFPIALSLTATLLYFLSLVFQNEARRAAALWKFDPAAQAGLNGYLGGRLVFTEGVAVCVSQIHRPPDDDDAGRGGHLRDKGVMSKDDLGVEDDD